MALTIDGSQQFQAIDGFGVNVNSASWNNGQLRPALDLLVDQLGATIFRVVIDNADWETANDNGDPQTFNWTAYNGIYTSPKFEELWGTIAYLNQKGITQNLMLNIMGPVAAWMGGSRINPTAEDEWVEMIASLTAYARNTRNLQFGLLSPMNEPDWDGIEGPQVDEFQYVRLIQKLSQKLDALALSGILLVGPDTASVDRGVQAYFSAMVANATLMAKLAHFGLHNYAGYTAGAEQAIASSPYPSKNFWMTEVSNIWDALPQLVQGAAATLVWDAFDSVYNHAILAGRGTIPPNDAGNGPALLAYNTATGIYTPRKAFFEHAQLFRYVVPGARRIAAADPHANLTVLAFHHATTHRLTIVGRNAGSGSLTIAGSLANLPAVSALQFYLTDASVNMQRMADVPVSGNAFTFTVAGGSTFTLVSSSAAPPPDSLPPSAPNDLAVVPSAASSAGSGQVRASWVAPTTNVDDTPLTDLAGYRLYYGLSSGEYTGSEDVSQQTTYTLSGLEGGRTYYVSVTAYDNSGNESDYADEASVHVLPGCLQTGNSFLWGRVTAGDVGLPGVMLTLRGPADCLEMTTTGDLGLYHFSRLGLGAYTLTPEAQACTFTPANQGVELTDRLAWLLLRANCP
jgi:O-glycosyl hydrolase